MDNFDFEPNDALGSDAPRETRMTARRRRSLWDSNVDSEPNNALACEFPREARRGIRRRSLWHSVTYSGNKNDTSEDTDATANPNREPGLSKEEESRWAATIFDGTSCRSLDVTEISVTSADSNSASEDDEKPSENDRRRKHPQRKRRSRFFPVDTAINDSVKLYMISNTFCC